MIGHKKRIGFNGGSTYELIVECDEITKNELIAKINPCIRAIVVNGKDRFDGKPIKKPCGCGDGT